MLHGAPGDTSPLPEMDGGVGAGCREARHVPRATFGCATWETPEDEHEHEQEHEHDFERRGIGEPDYASDTVLPV